MTQQTPLNDPPPTPGWTVQFSAELPPAGDPLEMLAHLDAVAHRFACEAAGRADYAWDNPAALSDWASGQSDAIVQELYATCGLAIATNRVTVASFTDGLTTVLAHRHIALTALNFFSNQLTDALTRGLRLATVARTLYGLGQERGITLDAPPDSSYAMDPDHAVINTKDDSLFVDPEESPLQITCAMRAISDVPDLPDDGRVPFEELVAHFTITPQAQ